MLWAGQILLTLGTLIVVVPVRDAVVIVADSKTSRRTSAGQGVGASATEKVFALEGVPGTAFFVTGITPVEWVSDTGGVATVVDARGLVTSRLSRAGRVMREDFDALADESAKIAARIHQMGELAAPLAGRDLFTVVMVKAGSGAAPHEVASFVVRLMTRRLFDPRSGVHGDGRRWHCRPAVSGLPADARPRRAPARRALSLIRPMACRSPGRRASLRA